MIRITGGKWNGHPLATPAGDSTRPTQARLRQALFNSIQGVCIDASVLDLFAGSGSLGFEALSRGASRVTWVDQAPGALRTLKDNCKRLHIEPSVGHIVSFKISPTEFLPTHEMGPWDLILVDPPYHQDWEEKILLWEGWVSRVVSEALLILEWAPRKNSEGFAETVGRWTKIREKDYGESRLTTWQWKGDSV